MMVMVDSLQFLPLLFSPFLLLLPPPSLPLSSLPLSPISSHTYSLPLSLSSMLPPISFPPTNLHYQGAKSLQQWLRQQGGGALLKAPTQKQQNFCLDGGVLVPQCFNHFILDATKSRLGRVGGVGYRGVFQT